MNVFKIVLALLIAFTLSACGLFDKKPDPNYATQMDVVKTAIEAKKAADIEKAKAVKTVQVLSIKGKDGQPMIMSGVSEITVNLPVELFEKGGTAEVSYDKMASNVPAYVEQPSFLEKAALLAIDKGLAPGIMMWGNVVQSKEHTKQAESTNSMWRDIILGVSARPTPNSYTYNNSYNTGDNQGQGSGNQRDNSAGNYGQSSGDNRDNPNNSVNNAGDNRNNATCRPVPPATTC
jgi:hypothetical protein